MTRLRILNTIDAAFEWEPSNEDRSLAIEQYGADIEDLPGLTLEQLCRLLFAEIPAGLLGGQYLQALLPPMLFKGQPILPGHPRPNVARQVPGRIVYGEPVKATAGRKRSRGSTEGRNKP